NVINEIKRTNVFKSTSQQEEGMEDVSVATFTNIIYDEIQKGRSKLSSEMLTATRQITPQYGINLIDIKIRQIKYSEDLTQSVYNRMIKERNQIAQAFRSDGQGRKAQWIGKMERELATISSGAYKKSQEIKGKADAQAAAIYANAYKQDPDFYRFWKATESYKTVLPKFKKTFTTSPEYFNYLYNQAGR
ncbi:MAG: protease modulator HflC, partial [Spirochaetales bacterium]|nr:protease modulator HflC [Spirochaetales bacterium]